MRCSLSLDALYSALGRDSVVAIVTELRAGRAGNRIPVAATFSALIQIGPEAHPASCTVGTRSFPGENRPERGLNNPPTSNVEVKERAELYLHFPSVPSWHYKMNFTALPCYIVGY